MASLVHDPATKAKDGAVVDGLYGLIEAVRNAAGNRTPLAIRGSNTKSWYGHRVEGTTIDVRAHSGIVDYEPSELVLVARGGTPLREIEALLGQHRQMLAFEPPHFAPPVLASNAGSPLPPTDDDAISLAMIAATRGATIGGCVATGLSGPRRMAAGSVRDFVLGARLIDGRGQHLAFGGQVMKNVAGYDVSRALVGSLGMLGIVTEVSLKVLPIPMQAVTLSYTIDEQAALDKLNQWAGQPIAITASSWVSRPSPGSDYTARGGRMLVRLEGSEPAVQAGIRRLGGIDVDPSEADATWLALREQTHAFFGQRPADAPLWRIALPPTTPALDAVRLAFDDQLIEWGGALRWIATRADPSFVRDTVAGLGGHATLWRASNDVKATHGVFAPLSAPLMAIHRRLKTEFDPDRLFNRGRMYPEL